MSRAITEAIGQGVNAEHRAKVKNLGLATKKMAIDLGFKSFAKEIDKRLNHLYNYRGIFD